MHRILAFNQSPWLKTYINLNTENRKEAKSKFEQDFFKLKNNSVFEKTIENLRKRENISLIIEPKQLIKHSSQLTYINSKIFNQNLVAIHKIKASLTPDRPAYVGIAFLTFQKH